jgi:small subunit ribosomal protein S6
MPLYEHVFLARQDVSTAQAETMMKEYQGILEANGGKVTKSEYWGLKPLAYKVKKSRKAHYALFNIDAPHAAVAEMERNMGISVDVLRFITIRVEEHETEPSAMMRKSDRDERPRGAFGGPGGDRGGRGGDRGGFRGDRPPREGGGFGDRPPREAGASFGDRPPREAGSYRNRRDGVDTPGTNEEPTS